MKCRLNNLNAVHRTFVITSGLWLLLFGACAAKTPIATWILTGPDGLRHHDGSVDQAMTIVQASGFRCYSELDDQTWRTLLAVKSACCDGK